MSDSTSGMTTGSFKKTTAETKLKDLKTIIEHIELMIGIHECCEVGNPLDDVIRKMSFENVVLLIEEALRLVKE